MQFQSTHNLDFLFADYSHILNTDGWMLFRIGTCQGQWRATETHYELLSIINDEPGNGHLDDVFEWFENSCKRDEKGLMIREVMNNKFRHHLVTKRGFIPVNGRDDVAKTVGMIRANPTESLEKRSLALLRRLQVTTEEIPSFRPELENQALKSLEQQSSKLLK